MKFHVINLGCKVNRVESDSFIASLMSRGWENSELAEADVLIINTCMVTGEAEKKTRKTIRRALRENLLAYVVVTGCAAALDPHTYKEMDKRVYVEADKTQVVKAVEQKLSASSKTCSNISGEENLAPKQVSASASASSTLRLRLGNDFATRVGIKIQDGCDNACTYCIVHKARGKAWSRPSQEIIKEVCAYDVMGVKEVVLTGINLGSYCESALSLSTLLEELLTQTTSVRFRLSSIEPHNIDKRLINVMAQANGRVCRHLHLPLQSGSSRILKEMDRPYDVSTYMALVKSLYDAIPNLSLSTDIIVGFPSEDEFDFEETMRIAQECAYSKIHVFPYSKREGTPAANRLDQVDHDTKFSRTHRLNELAKQLRQADLERRRGTKEYVLVEACGKGTTESYHQISTPPDAVPGELIELTL